jgi:hypothetical protein
VVFNVIVSSFDGLLRAHIDLICRTHEQVNSSRTSQGILARLYGFMLDNIVISLKRRNWL